MKLKGSCQCGAVRFTVRSAHPVPYQRCYCSICRKTQGGGGFAINLGADARTLEVSGREHVATYHAHIRAPRKKERISSAERAFCKVCGSGLWLFSPEWPELIHPHASAIDTALPVPPEHVHMMLDFKPDWVEVAADANDRCFADYPEEAIAEWHERLGLSSPSPSGRRSG